MKTTDENIKVINKLTETLSAVIDNRNALIEISQEFANHEIDVTIDIGSKTVFLSPLGQNKIIDFLIGASNDKINELKKDISDALFQPQNP